MVQLHCHELSATCRVCNYQICTIELTSWGVVDQLQSRRSDMLPVEVGASGSLRSFDLRLHTIQSDRPLAVHQTFRPPDSFLHPTVRLY